MPPIRFLFVDSRMRYPLLSALPSRSGPWGSLGSLRPTLRGTPTPKSHVMLGTHQKQRWLAAALLDIEPRLRRLLGYRHLPLLRAAIQKELGINHPVSITPTAA